MELGESKEDYLEATYLVKQKYGYVRNAMLSEYMNYSKPSISVAMKALTKQGYVVRDKYEGINLTPEGEAIAKKIYARHLLLKEFLEEIGVTPETADHDACRIEHTISDETYECLKKLVDEMRRGIRTSMSKKIK